MTVDNNDARRNEIIVRVNNLNKKLSNPESYHLDLTAIKRLEAERDVLIEECKKLPVQTNDVGITTLRPVKLYANERFTLKQRTKIDHSMCVLFLS